MATGGYKCVSFSWQGGRTDSEVDRVKFILNGLCDAIVNANVGWAYDTLTPTSTDFLTMPSANSSTKPNLVKALKLEYNSHTYKLCIGYRYDAGNSSYPMKPTDVCPMRQGGSSYSASYVGYFSGCLYFSMIKDGTLVTDSTYGWVWDGNGQFLRWMPFAMNYGSSGSASYSCAKTNNSSILYTYYVVLKGAQVALCFKCSDWGTHLKCIIAGEIFKETGHVTDAITFGAIGLNELDDTDSVCSVGMSTSSTVLYINAYPGTITLWHNDYSTIASQIFAADGTLYSNTLDRVTWKCCVWFDTVIINNSVTSVITSPGGRWTPVWMYIYAADHDTYGVVPGDGFKGYIDTDLLRGVNPNYSYGQQLDNGKFVYLGGGFAIGWDPNNTTLLF